MGKKRRGLVERQKLNEISGNEHSYERYVAQSKNEEVPLANPDLLPSTEAYITTPQAIMAEAIEHLQGRQKEVYLLHMRCDKSLADIGSVLDISKGAAQTYLGRAVKFVEAYCHQAILRGRV
jgi:DNA-directed RNA polymerase specialized sigma24 family protein